MALLSFVYNILVPAAIGLSSAVLTGIGYYFKNDRKLAERIVAVETQQKNDTARLQRIEEKLDRLLERRLD